MQPHRPDPPRPSAALWTATVVLGLAVVSGLFCGGVFGWHQLSVSEPEPKSAITVAGTRWILDRNGPSTCVTLEYRAQPLREAPGLQHQTFTLDWPLDEADDDPLIQIDVATLIGHISLRQHTLCWS